MVDPRRLKNNISLAKRRAAETMPLPINFSAVLSELLYSRVRVGEVVSVPASDGG